MGRTRDHFSALQCQRNQPLQQQLDSMTVLTAWLHNLHVFERDAMITVWHRDKVFELDVHHFRGAVVPDFILMDDNSPHRAPLVDELLDRDNIHWMDISIRSPDLKPYRAGVSDSKANSGQANKV
ncbi:hypothetical protein TNCV_1028411 [Trichonephila clavipes]|nr:hypothetical protein TNCV_1028411 [Trichonephila clavipes]